MALDVEGGESRRAHRVDDAEGRRGLGPPETLDGRHEGGVETGRPPQAGPAGAPLAHLRPAAEQSDRKVTLGCAARALGAVEAAVASSLAAAPGGPFSAALVSSGEGAWRYLDVLPAAAGKRASLEHVRAAVGAPPHLTLACGDSGNDILMLEGDGSLPVCVGNAQPQLREWAEARGVALAGGDRADGVLAALGDWGLL